MWTVISVCFIIITSIYGITEILRELWLWIVRPKDNPPGYTVVVLKNNIFKEQLRLYEERLAWESSKNFSGIIAVTSYLNEENLESAIKIINDRHNITTWDRAAEDLKVTD